MIFFIHVWVKGGDIAQSFNVILVADVTQSFNVILVENLVRFPVRNLARTLEEVPQWMVHLGCKGLGVKA